MVLRGLYTILLGIFLTLFVGIGITTFYPEPVYQPPAPCLIPVLPKAPPNDVPIQGVNKECERAQNKLNKDRNMYVQIISSISLASAVLYLVLALVVVKNVEVFSYGFLFGSIFTLLYSVMRGLGSNQAQFKFILICISLAIVMLVGYVRFIKVPVKNNIK